MKTDDDSVSGYGISRSNDAGPINFSRATKLERGGSTCDVYLARMYNKTVFVKRLKEEFRSSSVHRTAFAKEFELGINLLHPALPVYRDIHDDYIVMDYIDGFTLGEMIARGDRWLMNPENIRGMLRRLVEVTGYLHSKNILHSDIKQDNVMITRGTRNTMLIDLDKAYTFTHNDTAGAPDNYGLENDDHGNPAIDFNGIARIVDRLTSAGFPTGQFRRFRRLCQSRDVTVDKLLKSLERSKRSLWGVLVALLLFIAGVTGVVLLSQRDTGTDVAPVGSDTESSVADSLPPSVGAINESEEEVVAPAVVRADDYLTVINRELGGHFKPVEEKIREAEDLLNSGTATDSELREANSAIIRSNSIAVQRVYKIYVARFPEVEAGKVELAIANSAVCRKINDRQGEISGKIASEIMRRHPESYTAGDTALIYNYR